ncbi:hypothetical protein AAF712_010181 [Marasmius tenuissimus]|uniref:Uncharacterized protein n=1 Tax=Marasmius tenuissimus TaxID=585030 RepID=A0ABR2ZNX7_9AGAR
MAAYTYTPDSFESDLLRNRSHQLYPHLSSVLSGMGKTALTNAELGADFVKRVDPRTRNYGFADNAGRVMSTNVFGEILGGAHGTNLGASGTHYWGETSKKVNPITDRTKVKQQIVIGCPSFAPQGLKDDFRDQVVVFQDIRDDDIDDEDGFVYAKTIVKHSANAPGRDEEPDLIVLTVPQCYTTTKDDSFADRSKVKEKEASPRRMRKRKANSDVPDAEVPVQSVPSLDLPVPEAELPGLDQIRVGAEYAPNVYPDYGGPGFQQRIVKARQPDFRDAQNKLIPPWMYWSILRPGVLIMANVMVVVWVIPSKNKQGRDETKKIYHAVIKSLRVLGESDVPVSRPLPNLTSDLAANVPLESDEASAALSQLLLPGQASASSAPAPVAGPSTPSSQPASSDSTVSDNGSYMDFDMTDGPSVNVPVTSDSTAEVSSRKGKKARR